MNDDKPRILVVDDVNIIKRLTEERVSEQTSYIINPTSAPVTNLLTEVVKLRRPGHNKVEQPLRQKPNQKPLPDPHCTQCGGRGSVPIRKRVSGLVKYVPCDCVKTTKKGKGE